MLVAAALVALIADVRTELPSAAREAMFRQASAAVVEPARPWPPAGVSRLAPEITPPRLIKETRPNYTTKAKEAGIQGSVVLEAVVRADGRVGEVRVARSLDKEHGLDDEAVKTVRQWRFAPGTKDGAAVPVLVEVEITFSLR